MKWLRLYLADRHTELMTTPGRINQVAVGFAVGIFVSFTPFVGLHLILIFIITRILDKSFPAGVIASLVFNPVTAPFALMAEYEVGRVVLRLFGYQFAGRPVLDFSTLDSVWQSGLNLLGPMAAGGFVLAPILSIISYFWVLSALKAYRAKIFLRRHPDLAEETRP